MATVSITNDLKPYLASLRSYLARENKEALYNTGSTAEDGSETHHGSTSTIQENLDIGTEKEREAREHIEDENLKVSSQKKVQPLKRLQRVSPPSSSKKHYVAQS